MSEVDQRNELKYTLLIRKVSVPGVQNQRQYVIYKGRLCWQSGYKSNFRDASLSLEKRLPEPNRIADIFVTFADGRQWAIEFQCAPLDIEEWHRRHTAYREAGIRDTWIIGSNRREKQEAFIEAIIASASEVMFVDPLLTPPLIWIRWAISS